MSATDVHDGFWPNVAAPGTPPPAIEAGSQPIALDAGPASPPALESAPTIASIEAGTNPDDVEVASAPSDETGAIVAGPVSEPIAAGPVSADETVTAESAESDDGAPIALAAGDEVTPLTAEPITAEPIAAEPVEEPIAAEPIAAEPIVAAPVAAEPVVVAVVEEAPTNAPTLGAQPAPSIDELAAELDDDQRLAMADVIDLADFDSDPIDTGLDAVQLDHLPIVDQPVLGGGNLDAVRASQPRTLAAHRELEAAVMTGTDTLSEFDRTLIGLIVAIENRSGYWQVHLRRRLEQWLPLDQIDYLARDWTATDLPVRERAMLAFAVKLTLVPGQMVEQDAQLLGNVGFGERDLIDIVDVIAYWGFATRVAEGLGVFVEPWLDIDSTAV